MKKLTASGELIYQKGKVNNYRRKKKRKKRKRNKTKQEEKEKRQCCHRRLVNYDALNAISTLSNLVAELSLRTKWYVT